MSFSSTRMGPGHLWRHVARCSCMRKGNHDAARAYCQHPSCKANLDTAVLDNQSAAVKTLSKAQKINAPQSVRSLWKIGLAHLLSRPHSFGAFFLNELNLPFPWNRAASDQISKAVPWALTSAEGNRVVGGSSLAATIVHDTSGKFNKSSFASLKDNAGSPPGQEEQK